MKVTIENNPLTDRVYIRGLWVEREKKYGKK
jgi:hypothetical protein